MDTRLMKQIKDILKEFPQYWNGEELQRPIVIDDLKSYNALLISALLKNQKIRENYSVKAGDVVIFKVQEFIDILRYKDYWADSYTKYSNTIGLSSEGKYLQYNTDVVLDFPYKDCVLEGGMTKEDTGKEEVFYNEVIARDEIDTLLSPKALVNVKKYDTDGEHTVDSFSDEDNLIIKGNNLLALHSLKERYAGKVKLVYIDVPYNTEGDSFKYNDRFSRTTWLTFIKNRVEIAKELLSEEGVFLIQISFHQYPYLRVLLDDKQVLGEDCHLLDITTLVRHPDRTLTGDKEFNDVTEFTLVYAKNKEFKMPKKEIKKTNEDYVYSVEFLDTPSETKKLGKKTVEIYLPDEIKIIKGNPNNEGLKTTSIRGSIREKNSSGRFYVSHIEPLIKEYPSGTIFKVPDMGDDSLDYRLFSTPKEGLKNGYYFQGMPQSSAVTKKPYPNFVDFIQEYNLVNNEGVYEFRNGKKPEKYIKYYIDMFTSKDDIVLDFFMGSATTQAVAMKMNRRFIGIEQMDYINTVSVPRLQKVIEGEQGGISKDVNWQGGGSFVYAELMEFNQLYMDKIDQVSTKEELADLWNELDNNADLNFQLDKEKLVNELLKENDEEEGSITFNDLTFDEQKEIFKKAFDKNQLYVPYSEIEDTNVIISDSDKSFNYSFYNGEVE